MLKLDTDLLLQVEGIEVTYRLGNGNGTGNESDSSWTIMLGNEKVNPGIINLDRTCHFKLVAYEGRILKARIASQQRRS